MAHQERICLAFEREARSLLGTIVHYVAGPQIRVEIVHVVQPEKERPTTTTAYSAHMHHTFGEYARADGWYYSHEYDWLELPGVSQETVEGIVRTCKACCRACIPYNYKDMMLAGCFSSTLYDPSPDPKDVFSTDAIYCAQSVVLILRACLPPDHPLVGVLASINSRSITPAALFTVLAPFCGGGAWRTSVDSRAEFLRVGGCVDQGKRLSGRL
jgi:hypothetical protein